MLQRAAALLLGHRCPVGSMFGPPTSPGPHVALITALGLHLGAPPSSLLEETLCLGGVDGVRGRQAGPAAQTRVLGVCEEGGRPGRAGG